MPLCPIRAYKSPQNDRCCCNVDTATISLSCKLPISSQLGGRWICMCFCVQLEPLKGAENDKHYCMLTQQCNGA
jgi:hypothetical protein